MTKSKVGKQLLDAQKRLQRAEDQAKAQEQKLEEARKRAADLEAYMVQVGVQKAQGEDIEPTVSAEQLIHAKTDLETQAAVFVELQKLFHQAERDVQERERALFADEWNRTANERAKINERIEAATLALKKELEALEQLDREQRTIGGAVNAPMNTRRFQSQENFIAWQLREFVEPAGVLPDALRRPINDGDRMTRSIAPPQPKKEVTT